jgi:DNA polymerase elongation subunit (family B)
MDESALVVSYYDEIGTIAFIKKPIQQTDLFNWATTPNPTEFRNWDNRFLKKVPSKYLSRFRLEELTQTKLAQTDLDLLYSDYNPNKYYLDIEIKLESQDFPDPAKALMEVSLISFVNEDNVVYTMSTTENFDQPTIARLELEVNEYLKTCGQTFTVKYMYFDNEEAMLIAFFKKCLPKIPFLTGWNVVEFDWIYLINRAKRIKINPMEWMPSEVLIGKAKLPVHLFV